MSLLTNSHFYFYVGIILITQSLYSSPVEFQCADGQVRLPVQCQGITGLQAYLNNPSADLQPEWQDEKLAERVRECMRGVRLHNMDLKNDSKSWCATADDQAFKVLMKIGQEEVSRYQAWNKIKAGTTNVVFQNNQCFGSVCYRDSFHGRYHPLQDQQGAAR